MAIARQRKSKAVNPILRYTLIAVAGISLYFLAIKAFPKLLLSEESYGDYYWYRAPWLFIHNLCGIVALVAGPFQFVPSIRNKNWRLHRNLGNIYVVSVLVASVTSIYLSLTSAITYIYAAGLFTGSVAWLISVIVAYRTIKQRKVKLHRQWMIRNYTLTFFFIIFFGFYDLFRAFGSKDLVLLASVLPWASLVVPLAIAELYIRKK